MTKAEGMSRSLRLINPAALCDRSFIRQAGRGWAAKNGS
jgi:hypothetical protein